METFQEIYWWSRLSFICRLNILLLCFIFNAINQLSTACICESTGDHVSTSWDINKLLQTDSHILGLLLVHIHAHLIYYVSHVQAFNMESAEPVYAQTPGKKCGRNKNSSLLKHLTLSVSCNHDTVENTLWKNL